MINFQSFPVKDYEAANKFLETHPIKGEMKLHDGFICIFYEVDDKENRSNRIQYLRGMLEAHYKKQWEYQEQMEMSVLMRDMFDKNETRQIDKEGKQIFTSWENGNANVVATAKMLEAEIMVTTAVINMLAKLGVKIEQPKIDIPAPEYSPNMADDLNKPNKNASKNGKA